MKRFRVEVVPELDPPYLLQPDEQGIVVLAEAALTEVGCAQDAIAEVYVLSEGKAWAQGRSTGMVQAVALDEASALHWVSLAALEPYGTTRKYFPVPVYRAPRELP